MENFHPKFAEAMAAIERGMERDPWFVDSDESTQWFAQAHRYAPPELKKTMDMKFKELFGPLPEPVGYSDDGKPLYSAEQVAELTDTTVEGVMKNAAEIREFCGEEILHSGRVHLRQ